VATDTKPPETPTQIDRPPLSAKAARAIVAVIILAAAVLALAGLGAAAFWDDEAQVGIVGRNLVHTGKLTGWDGRNLFGYRNGTLLDASLRPVNPPLDYLVAAASFKVFGASTWAGRLPFVLFGIASLPLFVLSLRRAFGPARPLWIYALASLALSPVFLLDIRNCRYYALSLFFTLLAYLQYRRVLDKGRWRCCIVFAVAVALAFYASYLLCAAFVIALAVAHVLFHRTALVAGPMRVKAAVTVLLTAALILPYALYYKVWVRYDIPAGEPWYVHWPTLLGWSLRELNLLGALPWMAAVVVVVFLVKSSRRASALPDDERQVVGGVREWAVLVIAYAAALAAFSPQSVAGSVIADVRYLVPILPFACGVTGAALWYVHRHGPLRAFSAIGLLCLVLGTNILTMLPPAVSRIFPGTDRVELRLPAYVDEVSRPYPTANQAVADYLKQNARQDDTVLARPEYLGYPLLFYVGDRVKICCQLNKGGHLPDGVLAKLDAPIYAEDTSPDWIVFFGMQPDVAQVMGFYTRPVARNGVSVARGYGLVQTLQVYADQTQRPELPQHSFGPVTGFDKAQAVYIFKGL
jgi:4-amino-4-deoxy-L-arabinose transferase-like glycosyltransferase